jgi:putative DNA primase/helicase
LFLNIGNGRNGKGVFLNTLKYLMGDYALQANFDSFTARKGGGGLEVRTDIARMVGARFVTASENDQDSRLAEGLLKTLTGSDTITARKLYVCVRGTHLSPEKQG